MAWSNTLFYIVFTGQILLISYYYANKLHRRMQHILETYPPASYPKLYPRPAEHYKIAHWAFRKVNQAIVIFGFVLLGLVMFVVDHSNFADDGYISEFFPGLLGVVQFLPYMAIEISEYSHLKQMRKANPPTVRKASMQRRGLFDLVPAWVIVATIALYLATIALDLYLKGFAVTWGDETAFRILVLTITNLAVIAVGAWTLYTRRQDPHQNSNDRLVKLRASITSLFYASMALSVFFMTAAIDDVFSLDPVDATLMSLYFQVVVYLSLGTMLRSVRPEDLDFEVYRNDVAVT